MVVPTEGLAITPVDALSVDETPTVFTATQGEQVKGRVVDASGNPMPGVTIQIKGSNKGTVTNMTGVFTVDAKKGDVLVFSFIGFQTVEKPWSGESPLNVVLKESTAMLDELVVVGYGIQKAVNLTGSVTVVDSKQLNSRPIANVSSGLQGLVPGLTVTGNVNGGLPGQGGSSFMVRGIGSRTNNNPLILIDGAEGDINRINPNDIESISVLKDAASASIYGNRAANGVILITTKSVKGSERPPHINVSSYYAIQQPTKLPQMVDSPTYMRWENEARRNVGQPENYTEEDIQKVIANSDPNFFANTDWIKEIFKKSAPQYSFNASLDGKAKNMGYYLSYGFLGQEGLTIGRSTYSHRHNVRLKLNSRVADIFSVNANIHYTDDYYSYPSINFGGGTGHLYNAMRSRPLVPVRFTDGTWGYGGGQSNQVSLLMDGGAQDRNHREFGANLLVTVDLFKGWKASVNYIPRMINQYLSTLRKSITYYEPGTTKVWATTQKPNDLTNTVYRTTNHNLQFQTDYENTFAGHHIKAMLGYQQDYNLWQSLTAARSELVTEVDPVLNFGSKDSQTNGGGANHWAMRSGFGRLNYDYKDRYLFEANLRYDLTSRFIKENRAEWFPSVSAGWRLSEEPFMEPYKQVVNQLKLRVSWGVLGNQFSTGSDNYPYLSRINVVSVPAIGARPNNGYAETIIGNPSLLWEMLYNTNVGVDFIGLNNRLSLNADFYVRNTERLIFRRELPGVSGYPTTVDENGGSMRNIGWEFELGWRDHIGSDFSYQTSIGLSDVVNKVTGWEGEIKGSTSLIREGETYNGRFKYELHKVIENDCRSETQEKRSLVFP